MKPAENFEFVIQPDFSKVASLMCANWARPCWNYDGDLLKLHIMRPTGDPTLAVGQVSENGTLASFQAYIPFDVQYYGTDYRAVFASFLTVSGDFRGKGLAGPQQGFLIERAMEMGYDLYITMCEVGAVSNWSVEKIFAKYDREISVVNVLNYLGSPAELVKPILPEKMSGHTRKYAVSDKASVIPLVSELGKGTPFRKVIPDADIDFLFFHRPYSGTFVYEREGKIIGFVNLLLLEVLDTVTRRNVYFENVSFGNMTSQEQEEFLGDVLLALQPENYHVALVPEIGYFPVAAFRKFRFRRAPRKINLIVAPLKDGILADGAKQVDSFHLDVY